VEKTEKEYGRVSALQVNRFNFESGSEVSVYVPQIEISEYYPSSGKSKRESFYCITNTELEALQYAIKSRDNIKENPL
jgi:hypothetical protein